MVRRPPSSTRTDTRFPDTTLFRSKTKISELFGRDVRIIQGGMHVVGVAELASAVSNAGGLGVITALTQRTPDGLAREIERCRLMTAKDRKSTRLNSSQ